MTASQNELIERYVSFAIEAATSCRTAALDKMTGGDLASWNNLTELAEQDATLDLYARVRVIAGNNGGDWESAIRKVRASYTDEILTMGIHQSTNMFSNALAVTRHAQMRRFLADTAQFE